MLPVLLRTDFWGLLSEPVDVIRTYGVMIALAFMVAVTLSRSQAVREGEDPELVADLAFYLFLWGLVGARVLYIITQLDKYLAHPMSFLYVWEGGLVWYGGFIGAGLYVIYFSRRYGINFFKFADILIPYVALAHAIGRFGCIGGGCCYGKATDVPWAIVFPRGSMAHHEQVGQGLVGIFQNPLPVHPTQLYESAVEIGLFWLLIWLRPYKRYHGQLLLAWLSVYPVFRLFIEMLRDDKERGVFILSTSQYISLFLSALTVGLYLYLLKNKKQDNFSYPIH